MGQVNRETADQDLLDWIALFERLRAASTVKKIREVIRVVHQIVEGQELIASLDNLLLLRQRPTKKYRA